MKPSRRALVKPPLPPSNVTRSWLYSECGLSRPITVALPLYSLIVTRPLTAPDSGRSTPGASPAPARTKSRVDQALVARISSFLRCIAPPSARDRFDPACAASRSRRGRFITPRDFMPTKRLSTVEPAMPLSCPRRLSRVSTPPGYNRSPLTATGSPRLEIHGDNRRLVSASSGDSVRW